MLTVIHDVQLSLDLFEATGTNLILAADTNMNVQNREIFELKTFSNTPHRTIHRFKEDMKLFVVQRSDMLHENAGGFLGVAVRAMVKVSNSGDAIWGCRCTRHRPAPFPQVPLVNEREQKSRVEPSELSHNLIKPKRGPSQLFPANINMQTLNFRGVPCMSCGNQ